MLLRLRTKLRLRMLMRKLKLDQEKRLRLNTLLLKKRKPSTRNKFVNRPFLDNRPKDDRKPSLFRDNSRDNKLRPTLGPSLMRRTKRKRESWPKSST